MVKREYAEVIRPHAATIHGAAVKREYAEVVVVIYECEEMAIHLVHDIEVAAKLLYVEDVVWRCDCGEMLIYRVHDAAAVVLHGNSSYDVPSSHQYDQ